MTKTITVSTTIPRMKAVLSQFEHLLSTLAKMSYSEIDKYLNAIRDGYIKSFTFYHCPANSNIADHYLKVEFDVQRHQQLQASVGDIEKGNWYEGNAHQEIISEGQRLKHNCGDNVEWYFTYSSKGSLNKTWLQGHLGTTTIASGSSPILPGGWSYSPFGLEELNCTRNY